MVLHSSWSFIQLSLHGRFREQTNCLQHEARAADLCCQVTNTHFYCRAEMPLLDRQSLKAIDICQQRFVWKLQDSGLIFLLDSASGIQDQGFILLSLKFLFFVICVLTAHLRPNIKWMFCGHGSRWYPQVWVGGCGSTQCGNGSVTQCVGGGRNLPKFHRACAACLNFG